jgi:hypothetical protein
MDPGRPPGALRGQSEPGAPLRVGTVAPSADDDDPS